MKHPEIEKRIKDLLSKMTLEEKVGQLHQSGGSLVGAFDLTFEEILTMVQDGRIQHVRVFGDQEIPGPAKRGRVLHPDRDPTAAGETVHGRVPWEDHPAYL